MDSFQCTKIATLREKRCFSLARNDADEDDNAALQNIPCGSTVIASDHRERGICGPAIYTV